MQKHVPQAPKPLSFVEYQTVTEQGPEHRDQGHHGEALHHGGQHILLAYQAGVEERQPRAGHHEHQRRAGQHPGVVAGGLRVRHPLFDLGQPLGADGC